MAARAEQYVIPPVDFTLVASGTVSTNTTLPAGCRGLLIGQAGTLNVTMENGSELDAMPFFQGQNPGFFGIVRSGGTAENIWAIV